MTIKSKITLIILIGITCLFSANFLSTNQLNQANREYSSEESLTAHKSAWFSNMDIQFENKLLTFDPMDGAFDIVDYWNPSMDAFLGSAEANPLHLAFEQKDGESVEQLLSDVFGDAIEEEQITFAIAYDQRGLQLYCESSLYVVGVDPCSEMAQPDYFLNFGAFFESLENGSVRKVVQINDLSGSQPVSINDTLSFSLTDQSDSIVGLLVVGRNVIDSLELFSENFEIEVAIAMADQAITVYDYYDEEKSEEITRLIRRGLAYADDHGKYSYSFIADDLNHRISSIPFSSTMRSSDIRILVFDDQSELIASLTTAEQTTQVVFVMLSLAILGLVFVVTSSSFNRITGAIKALEKMSEGDLSFQEIKTNGLLASKNDEVSRLQKSIDAFREHRLEAEEERKERARRRDERDEIMFEKMSLLSDQLEGQARTLLSAEIDEMRTVLSSGSDQEKERASIDLMSRAFSRMSEEVHTLIDARTHELVAAKDEINSSIRYAAKLQNALLPKTFPGDININVEWRPRDLVGGDIYFIKDLPHKVYIAVVDCTGHGVPGAFLSIIARSHLDKAIESVTYQSAGEYLSKVNELLKETLSRSDQKNTSEEGFDGGVCIYYRNERRLEFAGAKASIFNVNADGAKEVSGDRRSVGSSRGVADFVFTTHQISEPSGAFVMLTDGITDVMSPEIRPIAFGRRRVNKILRQSIDKSPGQIVDSIMKSVDLYRGGEPFRDDLTLLAFSLLNEMTRSVGGEVVGDP